VPSRTPQKRFTSAPLIERVPAQVWPGLTSLAFVILGTAYFFRWGSIVQHHPSSWISPDDLWITYGAAVALVHGHLGAIYGGNSGFLAFPGFLLLLLPVAALSSSLQTTLLQITKNHHPLAQPLVLTVHGSAIPHTEVLTSGGSQYIPQPEALVYLAPFVLLLSCTALFACDALAERLDVPVRRRMVLCLVEGVALWNVSVLWGHPEDAVAVALALFAVIFALDERFTGAGWLAGAAVAVQPLVIVLLPILIAIGGRQRALSLVLRAAAPAAALTIAPLASDVHATVHALVSQPAYPVRNHRTPWTALAPSLGGKGLNATVGGGPVRIAALALAVAVGVWARRWRGNPAMLVWAVALALGLRCYTESVMTAYYVWPVLAVGVVVAARATAWRFGTSIVVVVLTTVVAQWHLSEWPWWILNVVGVTALLVLSARPEEVEPDRNRQSSRPRAFAPKSPPRTSPPQKDSTPHKKANANAKAARVDTKRSGQR